MKIISVVNPKGGAGKTVTAVNISYALHNRGKKVLLIDADARGAVSVYLGLKNENTLFHLIKEQYEKLNVFNLKKYIVEKNQLFVLTGNICSFLLFSNMPCCIKLIFKFNIYIYPLKLKSKILNL